MNTNYDMILLNQEFKSPTEIFETMAALALEHGYVDETYLPAIKKREIEFPTGLEMPVPIAIPHIETGVKQSFVSITTLKDYVNFKSMDLSGDDVKAKIVFVFGITNPKDQLTILQKFATSFRDKEAIEGLLESENTEVFVKKLNEMLGGFLTIEEKSIKELQPMH